MHSDEPVAASEPAPGAATPGQPGRLRRRLGLVWAQFLFRWAAFFGFIVSASNCPFCGRPGCPQGIATAGVASGILVAWMSRRGRSDPRAKAPVEGARGTAGRPTAGACSRRPGPLRP